MTDQYKFPDEISQNVIIYGGCKELMRFSADGTITVSPDAKPDELAAQVIECMRPIFAMLMASK